MREKYKVAKYIRLSLADGDNRESESVENQRDLLDNYVSKSDEFSEIYEYVDDGFSGGNFNRPAFQRMLQDIKEGKVNCIITKDLSRFGREHIETGFYLEKYFPSAGVRFIAVNDCVDTLKRDGLQFLSFKLGFNDYYLQDISNKIKSVKKKKMLNGERIGGKAPYGYKIDPKSKKHFIVDENVAPILKSIFEMYVYDEMTAKEIANELTKKKILVPSAYMNLKFRNNENDTCWQRVGVLHILRNMTYIGCAVSGKLESINPKTKTIKRVKRENHTVVENMHEPIIDRELWDLAQKRLNSLTYNNEKKREYPLKGLVYCGKCGGKANFRYRNKIVDGNLKWENIQVVCNRKIKGCDNRTTNQRELLKNVTLAIKDELNKINYTNKILKQKAEKMLNNSRNSKENNDNLKKIEIKLERIKNKISNLYRDKLEKNITLEEFQVEYKNLNEEKSNLEIKICNIKEEKTNIEEMIDKNKKLVKVAKNFLKMDKPDNDTLKELVKRIIIYEKGIDIELNFENVSKNST